MSTYQFLSHLYSLDVKLTVDGDRLRCKAPQGVLTQQLQTQIAEYKTELLKLLRHDRGSKIARIAPETEDIPLSFAQERLWFLNQLEGASATYNMPAALRLTGDLNLEAFHQALAEIVRRHEALRTSFANVNGTPMQVIHPSAEMKLKVIDLQHLGANDRESMVTQQVQQSALTPFDLEIAPLIRCSLLQLAETDYVFCINMHHIVSDGLSIGVLVQELSALYPAYCAGNPSPLKELEIQYADFALWQRQWLSGAVLEQQLEYWGSQLQGAPELLQLPTDRPRPSVQTYRGATHSLSLSAELTQQLQALSRQTGSTLFMTLMAAFVTLLYRYSGESDVVIGSPIANRNRSEIESLIGFFVNTLVLRTQLEERLSCEQLLKQVRETTLTAYEHQDLPFEQIVEALRPQRSMSHSPLFQVMFALQNTPLGEIELPSVKLSELHADSTIAKFDLTLSMSETPMGLGCEWEYNTDLFDKSTIERMASHFENLLSAIVENPHQAVGELPLLSAVERQQLLVEWNDTEREYPKDRCIHQLFEEQVAKTPNAVAVVFEQQELTYQQLNERANQLAHHLQTLGVKPEVLVGICVERSLEMVVGLLGILKAGGAYVPLDPSYPAERLSYLLSDAGIEVLLTQNNLLSALPSHVAQVVCLDTDGGVIELHSQDNLVTGVSAANLAYVIYTSGSTGQPKGVMNTHQGIRNRLQWMQAAYQLISSDRVLQKTPFSFDVSVWEFFWPLLTGARIVVAQPEGHKDSNYLINLITAAQITTIHFVPSMLQVFLQEQNVADCHSLQRVFCSGEALPVELMARFFEHFDCEFHNLYGPTEAAIDVTCWQCQPQSDSHLVPIGRPIANTQVYVLDRQMQPVPIGVAGELHIGGDGLAKGYLNRPELTESKFIPNPFSPEKSSRLYKTGDLARYQPDGNIEFLGRIDHQVKIRGFRIELGEIEAVLNSHPKIQQTVVIAVEDAAETKRLIAYVVVSEEEHLSTQQLREFLQQQLPAYMVPSTLIILDTLPLTPNGKVDRKALPAPDGEIERTQEYVAPQTQIEQILTTIWQELLLRERVSIHDNFFEIGGDSILSIQVVSRAKTAGVQITPKQLFQHQTIAALARVANTTQMVNARQGLVTGSAPLTPIQQVFWAHNSIDPHHYNQSVLLQTPPGLSSEFIATACQKLLEHHDALRLRFPTSATDDHQQINHGLEESVPFAIVDLSTTPIPEQPQALEQIATSVQASLNLSTGPIMQIVMFDLGHQREGRLLIVIHHLAVDGVSWRILLSDLETIYQQLTTQQPIQLSPKTTAFIDWAEKLERYAQSELLKSELDYWLNQPWEQAIPIPLDLTSQNADNTIGSTDSVTVTLSATATHQLLGSVHEAYNTQINDLLLTGLAMTLAQWTGNAAVIIDLEGHGREELFEDVDLSQTVGWFTSLFPVLLQLPSSTPPATAIKSIKEQLRTIPQRGIGYGILRYLCADPRVKQQLQRIPSPEISFNYLGQFDQVQSATGWKFAPESSGQEQSSQHNREHRLDLSCLVVGGELQISWTYSSQVHQRETISDLAQSYLQHLTVLIEHCQSEDAGGYTPSDFPKAQLEQSELDELLATISAKNIEAIYPLSPMQQGMLFHSLYAPESGVYVEQMTLNLTGNINVAAFESAWQTVVDRYSILRTLFIWENRPTPLQIVLKQVDLPWTNLDWLSLSPAAQQQQLSELLHTQRTQGFAFDRAPLMGCTLIQLTDNTYQLIWNSHHILLDGWCLPIIFNEVLSFYEAQVQGEICHLPTPAPYKDYITWLTAQDRAASTEFWRQMLQGFSAPTPLVVGRTVPQSQQPDSNYRELEFRLSVDVSRKLQALAQQHHVTLSTIIQAAWGLLLSRYSGEQDILFGVTVSGRPASLDGVEKMVGLFINTLPLRLQISPNQQLISWLEQIQQLMLELQQFSYTPLVEIQSLSEVVGGIPLFESIVVFENYPMDSSLDHETGSLQVGKIESREQTNFPLTVAAESGNELSVQISYDAVRFAEDTIERMLGHLQTIFSAIAKNPHQTLGELPLLSEPERRQLLVEWNDTQTDYPQDKCIHQLFEEQVAKTPDAIAVVFEREELTYQQLNERANQLAHYLQTLGVKPEVLVGICVERSLEMVVGLLGILKAGGAYVPLDPSYPTERLSYLLSDAGIEVLLTQDNLLTVLPSHAARVVCLDTDGGVIESHRQDNLVTGVSAENLAYVIYTSGSTGEPKGVCVAHRSVVRLVQNTNYAQFNAEQVFLQLAPITFDASTLELWGSLLHGSKLVIFPSQVPDLDLLVDVLYQHQITCLWLTAGLFHVMVDEYLDALSPVQQLLAGGDVLSVDHVQRFRQRYPNCRLIDGYGPTENTTFTCCYSIVGQTQDLQQTVPIGRPIANTQVYILDSQLQPVPIGVAGELHIGGDGLARGYLNRPELTQAKFIPHPFAPDKSARLYKTGDLARYLPDSNIEFLGRIDHQVKIRGFRIELGEIEAVLSSHPHVRQAVVIATEDTAQTKRLVAYAVSEKENLSSQQLREFLQQQLPAYMVPSAFVILDTLPLTPNGKVDRNALPAPDGDIERTQEYAAPRTPNEEIIAHIFTTVLGVETVGIHDNFFELGGHSLVATQLISRLKQSFSVDIPLRVIFESPTITQLDQIIGQLRAQGQGLSLPEIERIAPEHISIPLSFAQERLWFLNQLEGASATYNMPAALRLTGDLNLDAFHQALAEIVRRHEALRTSFANVNGTPMQVIHPSAEMKLKVIDLQHLGANDRESMVTQQVQQAALAHFDLEIAPLIRCSLLQLAETDYVFCINMHHIVSDGWSIGVLVQELSALYPAYCAGNPSPLKELEIQYADFALWQRQWLSGAVLEQQLEYWGSQLQGAPELLQLPTDRPRPSVQTYQGTTQSFTLSPELTQQLQALSRQTGSTLFMTLMAAFVTLLYRYSGESDVVIGSPIANRNRSEIEPLIGFFVNTLVLRTRLEDDLSFEQLLTQVRATTLTAYEHQDLPFEQIVEALRPQRSMSHSPLFQVMFALQNTPLGEIELPSVKLSELHADSTIAKFDLTLSMSETPMGLGCEWEYNTDLFDKSTIERMASHFENLLSAIVENPHQAVGELPLLSAVERQQLLVEWNDTEREYPKDRCIHQLFEEQVAKTPNAVAVVFEQQELTYQQLNQRANQLAHHLQTLGVKPEVLVGICVERSLEMVVGLLGILKAGGAYVPLDPSYPTERLSYMLSDAGIEVLLTQNNLLSTLPSHSAQVVCVDTDRGVIEPHSQDNLMTDISADNLAYIIYTSGSTGQPKGISIEHHSLCNLTRAQKQLFDLNLTSRVLQFASISFDASVWEIFMAVTSGATLIMSTAAALMPGDDLKQIIDRNLVTLVTLPPSALSVLPTDELPSLDRIIVAGEACPLDLAHQWSVNRCFFNAYGPSESTVCATVASISEGSENMPIGRPIANTQVYILDSQLQPVPIGVAGELHIGGDGLARGYLNRPELTQAKFIPHPFSPDSSARLYKTGDLARYLPDGNIEFLGRIDHQVKIRGFRIELGEIEAVLSSHPQIQQAVAIATEDPTGNQRLVAYVVSEEEELSSQQLREFLQQQIPAYMVPSTLIILDTLPLTPNGKVDRKALPAPDGEIERTQEYVAPQTQIEQILTTIWQELLLRERVSIHDNFFEIGGDSILSIQVVSRAKTAGVQITPKQLFQHQTIAALARVANTTQMVNARQGLVTGSAPLTPIQQVFWAHNSIDPHHYNQSVLLQTPPGLSSEFIATACQKLLEHHDALRLRFPTSATDDHQQINHGLEESVPFAIVDLSTTPIPEQPQALEQIATSVQASLNLSTGPIMQIVMFDLGHQREGRLLIVIHHLAVDGVSWRILLSDLETIYQQLTTQQPIQLSPKTTAFIDWAEKLDRYAQSELLKLELDYWLNQPWEQAIPIPLDLTSQNADNTIGSTDSVTVTLSATATHQLLGSVHEAYNTQINDLLLTGLAMTLAQWTGNAAVIIDLEGHGREELFEDVDLSQTVGWFTSLFPVLLQLPSSTPPATAIKSIKEQLRTIPQRGIGYGILRYLCADEEVKEQLQRIPSPEISFNYLGQFDQVQSSATGWKFAPEATGQEQSSQHNREHRLDLSCLVVGGELQISWTYSSQVHQRETISDLAQSYLQHLTVLIEHCQSEDACGYTPSDFPEAQLEQSELDELLKLL